MRLTLVDTLSTILFFTTLAALTELYVAGMEPTDVLKTRLIMVPLMILTGRPYGVWRDWFFAGTKPTVSWSKSLIDGLAFLTFQLPIYGLTLWIVGADFDEIGTLLGSTAVLMLIVSRPFGLFLQAMRKLAAIST
tara:strand:- start:700 stop:1104 length:405 start_codon:yes stop_codon:yes gene_type:complete